MLTRLKVSGFKNLVDVDVYFGPFTCIAGANGTGKSNLFDAIQFLSALADRPLIDAALSVRDEGGRTADVRSLFHRVGDDYDGTMLFEAEMIVPKTGYDDLGQFAKASITFLRYSIELAYRHQNGRGSLGSLELLREELSYINLGDAHRHLTFTPAVKWRQSAVQGRRSGTWFISTVGEANNRVIQIHQDGGGSRGRPLSRSAANLPRTVLSVANAAESPTALMARREMQSWRLLQLEPSSLRRPDEFTAPPKLGSDGSHLPAALYQLARLQPEASDNGNHTNGDGARVYSQVANRLSNLIDDVRAVSVDRDERRELLTLVVTGRDGTSHPARALSDGTLRFLALSVLSLDPDAQGLICLEEPENGIHPERIPAMLELLQDIVTDVHEEVGPDNPLRQVIVNTHSPDVVKQVPEDSLLLAESKEMVRSGQRFKRVCFSCLPDTWRTKTEEPVHTVPMGKLLAYLNSSLPELPEADPDSRSLLLNNKRTRARSRRVIDRLDLQQLGLFTSSK